MMSINSNSVNPNYIQDSTLEVDHNVMPQALSDKLQDAKPKDNPQITEGKYQNGRISGQVGEEQDIEMTPSENRTSKVVSEVQS